MELIKVSKLSDKIGGFATIPNTVIKMIPTLGSDAFTLWSYLRFRTNGESGIAFPSYETIKADTGMHFRKIAKALRTLEKNELLTRHKRFGNSSEYTLICPVLPVVEGKSLQPMQTNKTDVNKKVHTHTPEIPETPAPKRQAIDTLEKEFFKVGGTISPVIIEKFYLAYDANPDHPSERFQHALSVLRAKKNIFRAIDAYREWTEAKPNAPPYQRPPTRQPQSYLKARTD